MYCVLYLALFVQLTLMSMLDSMMNYTFAAHCMMRYYRVGSRDEVGKDIRRSYRVQRQWNHGESCRTSRPWQRWCGLRTIDPPIHHLHARVENYLTRQGTMCSSILLCVCTSRDTASGRTLCIVHRPPPRLFLPTWALCLAGAMIYLSFIRISLEH